MVKFLIATHGFLAEGFKSSINVLMGEEISSSIKTINAFVEDGTADPKGEIEKICDLLNDNDDLIIFTDLMYGSVNQFALPYSSRNNVFVITGINFPVICELISKLTFGTDEIKVTEEQLQDIINKSREQLQIVKELENELSDSDEDFFE